MKRIAIFGVGLLGLWMVAGAATARAELAPPHQIGAEPGSPASQRLSSQAALAEISGNYQAAVALADQAIAADPRNPWAHYDRASALSLLGQTDQAVEAFRTAEQRFSPSDRWARSIAIYGRAHTLSEARRCVEARTAFEEYALYVARDDAASAAMARGYAQACGAAPAAAPNSGNPARQQ
jgi:tetratricopeptide (TPR) repeat protein